MYVFILQWTEQNINKHTSFIFHDAGVENENMK